MLYKLLKLIKTFENNVLKGKNMSKKFNAKYHIKKASKTIIDIEIYFKLAIYFVLSFIGLFSVHEVLEHFNIQFFSSLVKPWITFLLLSIIIALIRYIVFLLTTVPKTGNESQVINADSDSLVEMLKDAEAHSRWAEIIKIGSALSEVLWFTSRKNLRVIIGHFIEVAATQLKDNETLASTLIEDLGNTVMGLGNPDKGIEYIKNGIEIAEKNNYHFLIMRGYRNLANCYAMKNDATNSEKYLEKAIIATNNITNESQKLEALGGIEYARCKTFEHSNKFDDALNALDTCIKHYTMLSQKYPETKSRNLDRLVKVYREKGVIYLKENRLDKAKSALFEGLRRAQETLNHENIVRCCTMIVKIQLESGELQPAEGILNIAKLHIDKIDTPAIKKEYNEISRKLEIEKESKKHIES